VSEEFNGDVKLYLVHTGVPTGYVLVINRPMLEL
jgi:hypothetical protein